MTAALVVPLDAAPDPLALLPRLASSRYPILLHGGAPSHPLSRYSFASADPVAVVEEGAAEWPQVAARLRATIDSTVRADPRLPPFQGGWAGWWSYELGGAFDAMAHAPTPGAPVPDVMLALYDWVVAWDHQDRSAWLISTGIDAGGRRSTERASMRARHALDWMAEPFDDMPGTEVLPDDASREAVRDFTPDAYRASVAKVVDHILSGDIFQANISQRFRVGGTIDPAALYRRLHLRNPAPMSAFIGHPRFGVVSASPERFLRFDPATRAVEARPIKGTRPRGETPASDAALAHALARSAKDRAENVMIVDLLRNDLSRVATTGSVRVPSLCALESHPSVHHLVSTVTAELAPDRDAIDLMEAAFPSGSVTGAPKIRAMELIADIEPVRRGIYCGAIGWLGLDGALDTSVAIRTITIDADGASLHAGGGVTAVSLPDDEYEETLDKARALLGALGAAC